MTRPIMILLAIIIVVFLPPVISAEPQGFSKLMVRIISIDKMGEEYEVSVMGYIPKAASTFSENYQIITAKGNCPDIALTNISKMAGKTVGLAHSNLILVNDELCEYGLLPSLDYLVREYSLGNNSIVLNTGKEPAKDVLAAAQEMSKNLGISLLDIVDYDKTHIFATKICLEELYSKSLSPSKSLLLGVVTMKEDAGIEISGGGSGESGSSGDESILGGSGGSGGSPSSSSKKKIANEGDAIILKDGKKVLDLKYEDMFSLNWGRTRKDFGLLELENYSDNVFTNANISFFVYQNNAEIKTRFENGKPICEINIKPRLMLNEIDQENVNEEFYKKTYHLTEHQLAYNLNKTIELDFSRVLKRMIENGVDILGFYEKFYSRNTTEFKEFLATLEDPETYISKIEVHIKADAVIIE